MAQDSVFRKEYDPVRRLSYALLQFATQQFSPTKQSRLHGPLRQAQALRRRRDIHFVEIEKIQGLAILSGKRENSPPNCPVPIFGVQHSILGSRIFGLRYIVDGHDARRDSPEFRSIQVGGQSEQPGRKDRIFSPLTKSAVGAQESLLSQILRTAVIPAEPVRQIDQRALPAAHDVLESVDIAGQDPLDVGLVVAGAHACSSVGPTNPGQRRLHFLYGIKIRSKNATETDL